MTVKVYTCEMERVKEGTHGSYNVLNQDIISLVSTMGGLVGRRWTLAVINGKDTSIYELTPEHWASYLAVKDTQAAKVEQVLVRINTPCIRIHPAFISLMCVYMLMIMIGITFHVVIRWRKHKIPCNIVEWAIFACKESKASSDNTKHNLFNYHLGVSSGNVFKIKLTDNDKGKSVESNSKDIDIPENSHSTMIFLKEKEINPTYPKF